MKILGYTCSEKEIKKKVIGVYTPITQAEYISLFAIANETSIAKIMNHWIDEWKKEQNISEKDLTEQCTFIIQKRLAELKQKKGFNYQHFFISLERELKKRSISSDTIAEIVRKITDAEKI